MKLAVGLPVAVAVAVAAPLSACDQAYSRTVLVTVGLAPTAGEPAVTAVISTDGEELP
jgi:hypothetical protein